MDSEQTQSQTGELKKLADDILAQMKAGREDWIMPWHNGLEEPFNPVTARVFMGRNAAILWQARMTRGYSSNQWATLKQWSKKAGKVKKGAKGVRVFVPLKHGSPDLFGGTTEALNGFRAYHVFNANDVRNYDPDHPDLFGDPMGFGAGSDHHLETLVQRNNPEIRFGSTRACYMPKLDCIEMPARQQFRGSSNRTAEQAFYGVLIHEMVHWTKHPKRLNRSRQLEDPELAYAFEELVAELGAAIVCTRFGQKPEPRQDHAAYLSNWLKVLNSDFAYFFRAFSMAQTAGHWLYRQADMKPEGWVLPETDHSKLEPTRMVDIEASKYLIAQKLLK